jgi:hypothetical protein
LRLKSASGVFGKLISPSVDKYFWQKNPWFFTVREEQDADPVRHGIAELPETEAVPRKLRQLGGTCFETPTR